MENWNGKEKIIVHQLCVCFLNNETSSGIINYFLDEGTEEKVFVWHWYYISNEMKIY